jgi:hypothetical protein
MAELIEEAIGQRLLFRNRLYVIPIDVYTALADAKRVDGRRLVEKIERVPSRYSRLVSGYSALAENDQQFIKGFIDDPSVGIDRIPQLPGERQKAQILDTLINYYSFRRLQDPSVLFYGDIRTRLIRSRLVVKQPSTDVELAEQQLPHLTQRSFRIQLSQIFTRDMAAFQELSLRPALYDELNPAVARPSNTSLVVFESRGRLRENELELRSLDLFRVSNLGTSTLDLPGVTSGVWKTQLGLRSQSQLCRNCLVAHFTGGYGFGKTIGKRFAGYALLKGMLQNSRENQGTLAVIPEAGAFVEISDWWKLQIGWEYESFLNGNKGQTPVFRLDQRLGGSQNWDARIEYLNRDAHQLIFGLSIYI